MLTPLFHISQTDEQLIITVHAPYTQLKDVEINALGSELWFYSSPYFLRLSFPCEVVDDDEPTASFNADKGEFEIHLLKQVVGQHFPDLDLLGKLLAPKKQKHTIKPSIEVLSDDVHELDSTEEVTDEDDEEWLIDQELPTTDSTSLLNAPKYGFGNLTYGVFQQVKSEFAEIIDLPDPDTTPSSKRDELRKVEEDSKFCSDHYLADFMEPDVLQEYLEYMPPWLSESTATVKLSGEEKECLKQLGNKELLLSKADKSAAWLSLIDIVFAFAYDHRTTLGESTVESAWTVNKLSATLSWFTSYSSVHSVIVTCFRRLLTYGLYRNWDLAQLVLKDTINILKLGRRQVLKCLLEVHSLFAHSETRYLLNQLYISDYCVWLQKASDRKLEKLTHALEQVVITKSDVGFDLEELEHAALLVQHEEEAENLRHDVENLTLEPSDTGSSSCSSYEDGSSNLDSDDESSPEN